MARPGEVTAFRRRSFQWEMTTEVIRTRLRDSKEKWISGVAARSDIEALLRVIDEMKAELAKGKNHGEE